ncbi:MAG: PTS sugar transporter subunit IIA [Candidatus Marinimicrobia bacterium]|nr:PTS sugar transporter subunit IIA [Candidatus Neomarinimicrobiota bacterium]
MSGVEPFFTDARGKDDILKAIAASAAEADALKGTDPGRLFKRLKERESVGSTGFGGGIAIPHCTLDNIDSFVIGALIAKDGAEFKSLDGEKVRLFIYIIAPARHRNEHIRILSEISKVLRIPANVRKLLEQEDPKAFFKTLKDLGSWEEDEELPHEFTQVNIHTQDSRSFDRILELFTEIKECNVSILEANNVSQYLYALPLFSHFMNEDRKGFHRMIIAVINTVYINETVRKIRNICEELNTTSKVLVTTQALSYYSGGIDI